MKNLITVCLILVTAIQAQAQWWGGKGIQGNGNMNTIEREVGSYDKVNVGGFFDVELVAGDEGTITLEGESNLLDYIITEVQGNALKIKVEKGKNLKPSNRMMIKITVPFRDLDEVTLAGSGDVIGSDLIKANNFHAAVAGSGDLVLEVEASTIDSRVAGSGDLTLSGSTRDLEASVAGSGDIHASKLDAKNVDARVAGSGDISVRCSDSLKARVSGSGDIEYSGNPSKQDTKVSGSGDISRN
jgi:hypothetical protein